MNYVGREVAKNKHDITILNDTGKMIFFTNCQQGIDLLHNHLVDNLNKTTLSL